MAGNFTPPKIYEDRYYYDSIGPIISDINTPEQMKRGEFYRQRYMYLSSEMDTRLEEWKQIENAYRCQREVILENAPNSFVPLITPIIEGQIASMTEKNITSTVKGMGVSDHNFAATAQVLSDFILRGNEAKSLLKDAGRRYLLYGMGVFKVSFDADEYQGFGMPVISTPQISKVYIDGKIKNTKDYQKADYIIEEIGFKSIDWARYEYGDAIANSIVLMNHKYDFDTAQVSYEDRNSFTLLHVWTRNNKNRNLQLIEMDKRGLILRESNEDTPYYECVNNEYPFQFFGLYPKELDFYRFGDGKLLYQMQDTVNKLYDEIVTACKFSAQTRVFIDPNAQCDPDQFDSDPSHPIIAYQPNANIRPVEGRGINEVVFRLVSDLIAQAQRVTRFYNMMSGGAADQTVTATQAGLQIQQGNTGINDKKQDISDAMAKAVKYCIGLAMEFWTEGQALRITENKDDFAWVNASQLKEIPHMIPATDEYIKKWQKQYPDRDPGQMPKFIQYIPTEDIKDDAGNVIAKKGQPQTKSAVFDIKVNVGEGLPTSKVAIYNIILSLAQLQLMDERTGTMRPLLTYKQVKDIVEDTLGFPIEDTPPPPPPPTPQPKQAPQGVLQPINTNDNIPSASLAGVPGGGTF